MTTTVPLQLLSVHLATTGLTGPQAMLRQYSRLERQPLASELPFAGELYLKPTTSRTPPWVAFLRPGVHGLGTLRTRSQSAVLLVRASRRTFAITFGHGSAILLPGAFEADFGIRTVLNSIEPSRIRSVDANSFEELPRVARVQTSRAGWLDSFGFDVERDVLRAVTGEPDDSSLCKRLTGRDGVLAVQARVTLDNVGELCSRLLRQYRMTHYQSQFPWFDHLRKVRDHGQLASLDTALIEQISRDPSHVRAGALEVQDMVALTGYTATLLGRFTHPDLPLTEYLSARKSRGGVTLEALRRDEFVAMRAEDGLPANRWSIYQCLQAEIPKGDRVHVLSGGSWFTVAKAFTERIREEIAATPEVGLGLPDAHPGEHECAYNARAVLVGQRALLDQKLVRCNGPRTEIEVCDLLTTSGQFIHVKRRGSSGVFSHLFAQGRNSAQAFLEEPAFREGIRERLKSLDASLIGVIPTARPETNGFTVVFAVVDKRNVPVAGGLPFLSQITLAQSLRYLRGVGFRVALTRIGVSV